MDFNQLRQFQLKTDTDIKPFKCADNDLNEFLLEMQNISKKSLWL